MTLFGLNLRPYFTIYKYLYRIAISIPFDPDDGQINRCQRYDVNFREIIESGVTQPNRTWPVKNCDNGYIYVFSDIPYATIATEVIY